MMEEEVFIDNLSDFFEYLEYKEIKIIPSEDKRKKKKKYIKNIFGEYVECEDEYDYNYENDVLRYPPDSNPPNSDNKLILVSHYMIINHIH